MRAARIRRYGPQSTPGRRERAIAKGKDGERLLGAILEDATHTEGVHLLHSLVRPKRLGDIDHVLVGPAGVSVIDAKNWNGRVTVSKGSVWNGRYKKQSALDGVAAQVAEIESVLADHGHGDVPVEGFLCLIGGNTGVTPQSLSAGGAIWVGLPNAVIARGTRAGSLDVEKRTEVAAVLRTAYRHGESRSPAQDQPLVLPAAWVRESANANRAAKPGRASERPRPATQWFFALLVVAVVVTTLAIFSERAPHAAPMTRKELGRHLGDFRLIAIDRARGTVHGPRVHAGPRKFRLVYRSGPHCLVRIDVPRVAGHVAVSSTRCRRPR